MKYLTSEIDWCENNFIFCDYIAEFWNTITSFFFIFYGLYGIYKIPIKKKEIYIFYLNNIFIGVTSVLFHGTLSIEGQILDELSIILYKVIGIIYLEKYYISNPLLSLISLIIIPPMVFVYPVVNRFLLFTISYFIYKLCINKRIFIKNRFRIN